MSITTPEAAPADAAQADHVVRVRFGHLDHQTIPLCVAEDILMAWTGTEKGRRDFGNLLRDAILAGLPPVPPAPAKQPGGR